MKNNKKKNSKGKNKNKKNLFLGIFFSVAAFLIVIIWGYTLFIKDDNNNSTNKKNELSHLSAFNFKKHGELTFRNEAGDFISKIDIEIADDNEERAQGLMYRSKLGQNQGMLFIFPYETRQSFWMRNTILPLDIIFVNKEKEIVKIHRNTKPFDESVSYPSEKPAIYVVEVNAGYTEKHNINEGDKIIWRVL